MPRWVTPVFAVQDGEGWIMLNRHYRCAIVILLALKQWYSGGGVCFFVTRLSGLVLMCCSSCTFPFLTACTYYLIISSLLLMHLQPIQQ